MVSQKMVVSLKALVLVALMSGCNWFGAPKKTESVAVEPKVRVVNVLSKELFDDAHIKGSINADFMELATIAQDWDKSVPVVVYCSNYACTASGAAAQQLSKLGFTSVKAYEGGMAEWYQLRMQDPTYEIEGPAQQDYLSMVVPQPAEHTPGVEVITAQDLKELLK